MSEGYKEPLSKRTLQVTVDAIAVCMRDQLTSSQRLEIMSHFCRACGSDDPRCDCVARWLINMRGPYESEG